MKRTITVYNSSTQKKSVLENVEVETLGQLKQILSENGINYNSMDFMEGVSQTKLVNDNSVLPHDIPYKGNRTNDLLIYLSLTDKKVKSGIDLEELDRRSLLAFAKENGYVEAINNHFGQNYTRVSTMNIISFLKGLLKKAKPVASETPATTETQPNETPKTETPKGDENPKECCPCQQLVNAFVKLVNILYEADVLDSEQYDELLNFEDSESADMEPKKPAKEEKGFSIDEIHSMMGR
jgi:hypothetical protein